MNSIVERLRGFKSAAAQVWAHEAADLIEQQAERIKELEAELDQMVGICKDLTAELTALRQRIADVDAENSGLAIDNEITGSLIEKLRDTNDARGKALAAQCTETKKLRAELTALRKCIDDAPVVAWLHEVRRDSDVITDQVKHLWRRVPVAVGKEAHYTIPLISKEDLQK